jgi:hypothetical protein
MIMLPPENKKSICYIRIDREVVTAEFYAIKHSNRTEAENLAVKGEVEPFHAAQVSNHRKLKFTMEIPEETYPGQVIDGEAVNG